jgi:hypothetical protein
VNCVFKSRLIMPCPVGMRVREPTPYVANSFLGLWHFGGNQLIYHGAFRCTAHVSFQGKADMIGAAPYRQARPVARPRVVVISAGDAAVTMARK